MKSWSFVIPISVVLSGCNVGSLARIDPHAVAVYHQTSTNCGLVGGYEDENIGSVNLDCFTFAGDNYSAYRMATARPAGGEPDLRLHHRNRLAAALTTHADNVCVLEKGRIVGREAAINFGLSGATSALAGASAIVGGELAKSILAGGAGYTNALRGHANESFYRNQITLAITAAMDGERSRLAKIIEQKRAEGIDDFTTDDMIRLVNNYHHACSFERGLQLLVQAAVNQPGVDVIVAQRNAASAISTLDRELLLVNQELARPGLSTDRTNSLQERRSQIEKARDTLLGIAEGVSAG